eukprot:5227797-Pyramimonas_sp.AAC.1
MGILIHSTRTTPTASSYCTSQTQFATTSGNTRNTMKRWADTTHDFKIPNNGMTSIRRSRLHPVSYTHLTLPTILLV